jgi:hypothetical protein
MKDTQFVNLLDEVDKVDENGCHQDTRLVKCWSLLPKVDFLLPSELTVRVLRRVALA